MERILQDEHSKKKIFVAGMVQALLLSDFLIHAFLQEEGQGFIIIEGDFSAQVYSGLMRPLMPW